MTTGADEKRLLSQRWAWALLVLGCAVILAWGYANYRAIPDRPRQWNFGQVPDAPGESIYSTSQPSAGGARQLAPLPKLPPTTREAR